jgi:hypothetical protein
MSALAPEQTRRLSDALFLACGLAWGAALVHAVTATQQAPVFAVAALAQLGWGIALYRMPSRGVLASGVLLSLALVALDIANPVGGLESVAAADEVALAVLAVVQLRRPHGARILRRAGGAVALYLVLLSSMSLFPGSPERGVKGSLVAVPRAGFQLLCHPG